MDINNNLADVIRQGLEDIAPDIVPKIENAYIEQYNQIGFSEIEAQYQEVIKKAIIFREICRLTLVEKTTKKGGKRLAIQKEDQYEEMLYTALLDFQNAFNGYLNQTMTMIFVYQDENKQWTLGETTNDLSHVTKNKYGHLSYQLEDMKQILKKIDNGFNAQKNLNATMEEVQNRWEISSAAHKGHRTRLPILWKTPRDKWNGYIINNQGTLKEAYAKFYLHKIEVDEGVATESSVARFISDKKYGARSVDNTPGFAIGDTAIQYENYTAHYAVKSDQASLLGYANLYRKAKKMCDDLISKRPVEDIFEEFKDFVQREGKPNQAWNIASKTLANAAGDYKKIPIPSKSKTKTSKSTKKIKKN